MGDSTLPLDRTERSWPDFRIDDRAWTLATLCFSGDPLHPRVPKRAQIIKLALLAGKLKVRELPPDHELSTRRFRGSLKERHHAVLRVFLTQRTVVDVEANLKCPPEVVPFLFEAAQAINFAANERMTHESNLCTQTCPKKKQQNPLDSNRPSHGRR